MERDEVAKRRALRRKKARKRRIVAWLLFFAVFAVGVTAVLSLTVLFPIKNVSFTGSRIYTVKQLEDNIDLKGRNLFRLTEKALADEARKALPYIASVKIERKLPDTVNVKITDAVEYAAYHSNGRYYVVSKDGYVLNERTAKPQGLIEIRAKNVKLAKGQMAVHALDSEKETVDLIIELLTKYKLKVNTVDVTVTTELSAVISDGRFKVNFGSRQDIERKIKHLSAMIGKMDSETKGTVNLSGWSESDPTGILVRE